MRVRLGCLALVIGLSLPRLAWAEDPAPTGTAEQTIRFSPLRDAIYLDPDLELSATASSGLPVSFTASGDCSVNGSTIRLLSAGKCFLTAHQPGDSRFAAARIVDRQFTIARADQTIAFGEIPSPFYFTGVLRLNAQASSGLPVSFAAAGACAVSGSFLSIAGPGSCTVIAAQSGSVNFNAAPFVSQTFEIAGP